MKGLVLFLISAFISLNVHSQNDGQKFLAAARKGNVKAMYQTAIRYHLGMDGIAKNEEKALYWAEKAGNEGHDEAMMLASFIYKDLETKKFDSKKLYWLNKAAEMGNVEGLKQIKGAYMTLKRIVLSKEDKRKCLEQLIYWNDCMIENPLLDNNKRLREFEKERYVQELRQLDDTAIQVETSNLNKGQTAPEKNDNVEKKETIKNAKTVTISTTINKSDVFFSRAEAKGTDIEIVCWLNPRINGTRMEAMSVKYELDGKLTSKQSRVSGYGGKELPRDGNVLNRGNRVNHGEKFYVTATIKNVAHLHSFNSVIIRVWTSYGEGDVIIKNVTW